MKLAILSKDDAQDKILNSEKYEYIKFLEQDERAIIGNNIRKSRIVLNSDGNFLQSILLIQKQLEENK